MTLSEKQVALLRWIADGCPDGTMDGDFYRISAAALRNRGLVTTAGRGSTWTATIAPAGRDYLTQVDGPNPPIPRQASVSVTERLVDDVIAAGGSLLLPRKNWLDRDGVDYENRARLAERYGKVPPNKRLTVSIVSREELRLELVDAPGRGARAELVPIVIADKVGRYHPAARQFRDRSERHEISRALLPRATRIVQALAVEAERRGWSAEASPESKNGYGYDNWTGTKDGHLQVTVERHRFWLRLQEEGVHTRGPWEEEVRRYRNVSREWASYRDRDLPSGPYDADASGRLKLELHADGGWIYSGRQSRWADRQSWTLEERLPHLFREIEERVVEADRVAEERRIAAANAAEAAARQAEEREREWHVLMGRAKEHLFEAHCAAHLRTQADAWQTAEHLRRYCAAVAASYGDHAKAAEWMIWARAYIIQLDPLTTAPTMPEPPEASSEALQQYLPAGWSVRGSEYVR